MKKRISRIIMGILTIIMVSTMCLSGCGKKKKITYGKTSGSATGKIDLSGDKPKVDIDNIMSPLGSDIDYTSLLDVIPGDGDYSVEVNASSVRTDKPGTYNAEYKITSGGETYTDNVKVTVSSDGVDNVSVNDSADNGANASQDGSAIQNGDGVQNNSEASEINGPTANVSSTLIPGGSSSYGTSTIPNAVIELLSGGVVTISCSTNKYIVSTRTDTSTIQRSGHNYSVSKLIIVFNTGQEQTLETKEKKID